MSSISICEAAVFSFLYMVAGAAKAVAEIDAWIKGMDAHAQGGYCGSEELAGRQEALKQSLSNDIDAELRRVGDGGRREDSQGEDLRWKELKDELESLKASAGGRIESGSAAAAVDSLNDLRRRICAAELDDEQCRSRTDSVRRLFEVLRAHDVPAYRKELARLESGFEKISGLPAEERMPELQGLLEELREMEKFAVSAKETDIDAIEERRHVFGLEKREAEDPRRLVLEIRDWAGRIAELDAIEGEKVLPLLEGLSPDTSFPDRLVRLRGQMKAEWGALRERAASTAFFRGKLSEFLGLLQVSRDSSEGAELIRRCGALLSGKFIDRALFMALYEDVSRFIWRRREEIADAFFARKAERALAELGYELLTDSPDAGAESALSAGQVQYLESPYEGYRVMTKIDSRGVLTTRLVRVVSDEAESGGAGNDADQKQKDFEAGRKWCRDFDEFLEKMREQDIPLAVTLRREPEEAELLTVVDKNVRKRKKKREKGRESLQKMARCEGDEVR